MNKLERVNRVLKECPNEAWEVLWAFLLLLEARCGTDKAIELLDGVELDSA